MDDNRCSFCDGTGKVTWGEGVEPTDCVSCEGSGYDTEYKDFPTCPYCGYEKTDEYYMVESGEWECPSCEKTCVVEVRTVMEFTTKRREG